MWTLLWFFLLLLGQTGPASDLLWIIDADQYFVDQSIKPDARAMLELGGRQPRDAQSEVAQLLAIRWLGEHHAVDAIPLLRKLVEQRPDSPFAVFARDYARQALALMDNRIESASGRSWQDLRSSLRWFPREMTFALAFDLTARWATKPCQSQAFQWVVDAFLKDAGSQIALARFANNVGNIRIERIALSQTSTKEGSQSDTMIRVTGQWHRDRLSRYLAILTESPPFWERRVSAGVPVTLYVLGQGCIVALIGDQDLVLVNYWSPEKSLMALQHLLAAREGKAPGILAGPLAASLRADCRDADGIVVGRVPRELGDEMSQGLGPIKVVPDELTVRFRVKNDIHVDFQARMKNAQDAAAAVEQVASYRIEQMAALRKLSATEAAASLLQAVGTIKVHPDGTLIRMSAQIPRDSPWAVGEVMEARFTQALESGLRKTANEVLMMIVLSLGFAVVLAVLLLRVALLCKRAIQKRNGTSQVR
jgi:hypothetical protein